MSHYVFPAAERPHWNQLVPGDTFLFEEHGLCAGNRGHRVFFGEANVAFTVGGTYLVVSRRIGPEFPFPKDCYVFLGPGPTLSHEVSL